MDKLIKERTKEVLEKIDKPKEFTKVLQELLKSYVDKDATKNYHIGIWVQFYLTLMGVK